MVSSAFGARGRAFESRRAHSGTFPVLQSQFGRGFVFGSREQEVARSRARTRAPSAGPLWTAPASRSMLAGFSFPCTRPKRTHSFTKCRTTGGLTSRHEAHPARSAKPATQDDG
jgi:hypothetical protein